MEKSEGVWDDDTLAVPKPFILTEISRDATLSGNPPPATDRRAGKPPATYPAFRLGNLACDDDLAIDVCDRTAERARLDDKILDHRASENTPGRLDRNGKVR